MHWFGTSWGAPICDPARRVETPAGANCLHCEEIVGFGDQGVMMLHYDGTSAATQQPLHLECHLRMIVGGANHVIGTCTCCGGTQPPDPPGLSKREAARMAQIAFERKGRSAP